jgi:transposase
MCKILTRAQFKAYNQQQACLLPLDLEELIPANHLVRVVNSVVDQMDLRSIIRTYKGGGTTSYSPLMLLKVILYAYSMKIYTGRRIAQALRSDVYFMWLSGQNRPDFRTINLFRSSRLKDGIEKLFEEMLILLVEHGYIKMETYFCDGSTFAADANKYKMVWRKNAERYEHQAREKCRELFKQIDTLNQQEDEQYGNEDLEQTGKQAEPLTNEHIEKKLKALNTAIENGVGNSKEMRKAKGLKRKLEEQESKISKYQEQQELASGRSGYSKTDTDATAMRMKNDELLPAYNVLASSENQFITACTVHQNTNDGTCFKEHLQQIEKQEKKPENLVADAGFGTAENYDLLKQSEIEAYVQYPSYRMDQASARSNQFHRDHFMYDEQTDSYTCPNNRKLLLIKTHRQQAKGSQYQNEIREYQCQDCSQCPFYDKCNKSSTQQNRTIKINVHLEQYRQKVRNLLNSPEGKALKKQRGMEIESCFGDIKHNMNFRRFHLRGREKVKTEWTVVAMAHNLRKMALKQSVKAA